MASSVYQHFYSNGIIFLQEWYYFYNGDYTILLE